MQAGIGENEQVPVLRTVGVTRYVTKGAHSIDERESGIYPFIRQFTSLSKAIVKFNRT